MSTSDLLHKAFWHNHLLKKCPCPADSRRRGTGRPHNTMSIKKILFDTLTFILLAAVLVALAYLAVGGVYAAISGQTFESSLSAMWTFITKRR